MMPPILTSPTLNIVFSDVVTAIMVGLRDHNIKGAQRQNSTCKQFTFVLRVKKDKHLLDA